MFDAAHNHKKYSVGKIQQEQITSQERKAHYHSELPIVPLSIQLSTGMLSFRAPGKMPSGELETLSTRHIWEVVLQPRVYGPSNMIKWRH